MVILAKIGLLLLGLAPAQEPKPVAITVRRADIERDLELVTRGPSGAHLQSWWKATFEVELVNRSKTASYPIVLPGDGSECDWREPYVHFTTEVRAPDGAWSTQPRRGGARCGVYDPNWLDEVVVLGPGDSRRLHWMGEVFLPPEPSGAARIRAHYAYKARPPGRNWGEPDRSPPPGGLGGMEGVEPFELVSAPVEVMLDPPEHTRVEIERDLVLELTREGPSSPFSWEPLRLHARLVNRSRDQVYRVVRPNFAVTQRSHEPRISVVVDVDRGDGQWRRAASSGGGFYDGPIGGLRQHLPHLDWRAQIEELSPGQAIEFELPASEALFPFQDARAARCALDYVYYAVPVVDARGVELPYPDALGAMAVVPPFSIRSNELTWPVRSPLEIQVLPREDRDPAQAQLVSDFVRVMLRNAGDEPIEISNAQRPAKLELHISGLRRGQEVLEADPRLVFGALVVPAHGEISLLEDPAIDPDVYTWLGLRPDSDSGPPRAQALLHRAEWLHALGATWKKAE